MSSERRPLPPREADEFDDGGEAPSVVTRYEEELSVDKEWVPDSFVKARKTVEWRRVDETATRDIEYAEVDRRAPNPEDSGKVEHLPDGSISIPVLEEQLVVTKRTVVRERIIIRKSTVTEEERIEADLRREHLEIEADGEVEVKQLKPAPKPFPGTRR